MSERSRHCSFCRLSHIIQHCIIHLDQTCLLWVPVGLCIGKHHPPLDKITRFLNNLLTSLSYRQLNTVPIFLPDPHYVPPVITYQPSRSFSSPPLYSTPVSPSTMIIAHVCKVRLDHFKVNWVEGRFWVNEWVQDYSWRGPMVVVRFVAENRRELVAECMGWAESGRQITRFLVLEKSWVDRLDYLAISSWSNICHRRLPKALDSEWYLPRGYDGNNLPLPYFSKPLSGHSTRSLETTGDVLGCVPFLQSLLYN